ncbi:MAG TPA: Ig-like domain-containing protein, partial [Pedobacter sp.]
MNKNITLVKNDRSLPKGVGYSKIFKTLGSIALLLLIFTAGCRKDEYQAVQGTCPVIVSTDPMDKAVDVVPDKVISITFNTDMDSTTINDKTFSITQGTTIITGKIATTASAKTFTFKPAVALLPFTVYTGTVTTGATDTFHTATATDYTWSFTTIPYVTLSSAPAAGGTTVGAGKFAQGALATVAAKPNTGYTFVSWTENGKVVSTSSSYPFTMAGNRTLVANFAPIAAGQFAVILSSNPIAGGTDTGSGAYPAGTTVTVAATPNAGYTFMSWTEG